ncbi:ATP-dependent DNA helicase RecQ [Pseudocercospora fuligena]|uniref:ATP-dependent DNA helicase n=1 Tax=Pseudocercospora fuligena TaxID=685502 RepID=A0A8H6VSM7_9PEZI|nr:ATP-dependent DNA helicase RecQ [Pseudocercospora fuligena]
MASFADDEDFGLSSSEEADLLQIDENTNPLKRKAAAKATTAPVKKQSIQPASTASITIANKILTERFGIPGFRLKQEAAITRVLDGGSSVVVFPTGGGKSLCYQVPALCFKELDRMAGVRQGHAQSGITLVVSPLLALMKDQVDALKRKGINAASLDSTKSKQEYFEVVEAMRNGTLDILYCAPERLNNEGFVASMMNVKGGVRLLAVDEAHCISEWGHAFRPDYLKVARFCKEIGAERFLCLTATATPKVAQDVCNAFDISTDGLFRTSTYRANLKLHAESYQTKKDSYPKLISFLKGHPGPTIIYVTLQKHTEELADRLRKADFNVHHFHAGMKPEEKFKVQDDFMKSKDMIICATIAFGMGIDKSDIRNVIHYDIPRSLEGYSQEIGRAGRDGLESHCMLYLCAEDLHLRESFARSDLPSKRSIQSLMKEVFGLKASNDPIPVIEASLYAQAKEHDIKITTLGSIYAQLELRFNLLRATTPKYTQYKYLIQASTDGDRTPVANAIRNAAVKSAKAKWTQLDVEAAARSSGMPRVDIVTKLNEWQDRGLIELQTSQVVNVFRVINGVWPPPAAERQRIIDALHHELEVREQQELARMKEVMDLITGESCFAHTLAAHFGDKLPYGKSECGHCTWCQHHIAIPAVKPPQREWDSKAFFKILEVCPDRDDPRYLARIAFGIGSPRITAAKLSQSPVFGSMEDHDFMVSHCSNKLMTKLRTKLTISQTLLSAFEKICEK